MTATSKLVISINVLTATGEKVKLSPLMEAFYFPDVKHRGQMNTKRSLMEATFTFSLVAVNAYMFFTTTPYINSA